MWRICPETRNEKTLAKKKKELLVHNRLRPHDIPLEIRFDANLSSGSHLTCFAGTKVQILTLEIRFDSNLCACAAVPAGVHFTCFTGTKVH